MPSASFFIHLGFFVRRGFLDVEGCEHLMAGVRGAERAVPSRQAWG
jgi:hypothetical protein